MNRGYTNSDYRLLIDKIRKRVPKIALSTDILCGFPGERDEDHAATVQLIKDIEYDAAFMFIYSKRKGTKAALMENQIKRDTKVSRLNEIIAIQMEITKLKNRLYVGNDEEVIVEGVSPKNPSKITARTRSFKNVILDGTESDVGKFLNVRITNSTGWALEGERKGLICG